MINEKLTSQDIVELMLQAPAAKTIHMRLNTENMASLAAARSYLHRNEPEIRVRSKTVTDLIVFWKEPRK